MQTQMQMPIAVDYSQINVAALSMEERHSILELAERVASYGSQVRESLGSPDVAKRFCGAKLRGKDREVFLVVFLDTQHQVIAAEEMFHGTIDSCSVHPRVVVKRALELNAAACIFSHVHPSGVVEPSAADRHITERLREALGLIEVRVLDHIVVGAGNGSYASFAERGWL